ncbi:hypothetical protein JAO73_10090 [Hymenobacter sp. BT523]|uniref:hypothetical protein n=1 Tax=Hymenobacter sp. BT523 TaxID=2795725 RepID=UPI0018EA7B5D|nr:hypothetical protein [Hymenobacter sp. BT523]MBJ6109364.1 hypothetical protein [Hymenobacter sp. BT523]
MKKVILPTLHDAWVNDFSFVRDTARLVVCLTKGAIDSKPEIHYKLIFSGIMNAETVWRMDQRIRKILQKERRSNLNYRIDNFNDCDLLPSETGLAFCLEIDHLEALRINCRKLSIQEV